MYMNLASIDIDSQQCFTPLCADELPVPDGDKIGAELNNQAKYAKFRIGTKDAHSKDAFWVTNNVNKINQPIENNSYKNIDNYWPVHAVPGTKGFELIPGLPKPQEYDYFVWKGIELDMHPYGACYHDLSEKLSTGLIEYLKCNNIKYIILGGLSLEFCVKVSAIQLVKAGFKVIINLAATRGIFPDLINKAKQDMLSHGVIIINNHTEIKNIINYL